MSSIRAKRILAEVKKIQAYNTTNNNIYISTYEEDINHFMAIIIGPKDTLYEGGFFLFDIKLPENYPFDPPTFRFISPQYSKIGRIHPNLYENGKVCLSILNTWAGERWSSSQNIISVCETIQSLLDNNPISHEPLSNRVDNGYKIAAKYKSLKMTKEIYTQRTRFPELICEKIQEKYLENKQVYERLSSEVRNETDNKKVISYFHGSFVLEYTPISNW